jgi:hypothetical protein
VQADGAVAEVELGLQEGQDVALDVEEVGEEPERQVAIPGDGSPRPLSVA